MSISTRTHQKMKKINKIVLKAAPHLHPEDVKNYFTNQNLELLDCTKMKSKNGAQSSSFLITTNNRQNIQQLKNNKELDHIKLRWEKYTKNSITQCWNCQEVGHGSGNCNKRPRCLKCAATHPTRECHIKERNEENRQKLKCCNCAGPHPANYRNCPYIQDYHT